MKFSTRFVMFPGQRSNDGGSMKFRVSCFVSLVACVFVVASVLAQGTDPVSGSWAGDWGPSPGDRNKVTVDLKWDGKALTGNITGGDNVTSPIALSKTTFDPKTGTIHLEATASTRRARDSNAARSARS
jgi:hypothetical protein